MIDAILGAVDPMSLPIWGVMAFAAGMYPIGLMLGAPCSDCCKCSLCPDDTKLPDTLTVTFSGFSDVSPGPDLITLSFSACYGGGAAGRVTAPGGDPAVDAGPITGVTVTNGGSGYAKLGRVEPTVTASAPTGSGASLTVTLAQAQDGCGVDYWEVDGIAVDDGGAGYENGAAITFSVAGGDTAAVQASATIGTLLEEPTLTVTAPSGSGAVLAVNVTQTGNNPNRWSISSITVTDGGTGYTNASSATIALGADDVEETAGYAYVRTVLAEPTLTVEVNSGAGAGADLTPTLTQSTFGQFDAWGITSVTINDGGAGYVVGDTLSATIVDGAQFPSFMGPTAFYATVSSVDGNGAITGISITYNGKYYKDTGVIDAVTVGGGGSYYKDTGEIDSVTVSNGGQYYREDATAPPYVATVTVTVANQVAPSAGAGASITATVGSDPTNMATFGKVTGLTVANGGDDYLAWKWRRLCCGDVWNGKSITLNRTDECTFAHRMCAPANIGGPVQGSYFVGETSQKSITVTYPGPSSPPTLTINSGSGSKTACNITMTGSRNVTDCADWSSLTFEPVVGDESASVSTGDEYDPAYLYPGGECDCNICCQGGGAVPEEVEVQITDNRGPFLDNFVYPPVTQNYQTALATPLTDMSGNYVLSRWSCMEWRTTGPCQIFLNGVVQGDHFRVRMRNTLCASMTMATGDYYEPDQYGCDECHTKCRTLVAIDVPIDVNVDSMPGDGFVQATPTCGQCEAVPVCGLAPSTLSMNYTSPFGITANMLTVDPV